MSYLQVMAVGVMLNGELTYSIESAVFPKSSILILSDDFKHLYADVTFTDESLHPFSQCFSFSVNLPFSVMVARI